MKGVSLQMSKASHANSYRLFVWGLIEQQDISLPGKLWPDENASGKLFLE